MGPRYVGVLPHWDESIGMGISRDGATLVGYSREDAFEWNGTSGMQRLPTLYFDRSAVARAANSSGSVIVGDSIAWSSQSHACRWVAGVPQDLGTINGGSSTARAVTPDGSVVVGTTGNSGVGQQAFRWDMYTGMASLGLPQGAQLTDGAAVSADGMSIVGTLLYPTGQYRAFFWTPSSGPQDLNIYLPSLGIDLTGWNLTGAVGISDDGTAIIGNGGQDGAPGGAWIVSLRPVCGSADFNHDGASGTDADIEAFFACIAGNCCPTCGSADFNGDGDVATDADIEAFFRVLAGGSC